MQERGRLIRELLSAQGLRPRDVERKSRSICEMRGNPEFFVSHTTLADIDGGSTPSIYKLYSLAACCGVSYSHILMLFGIDTEEAKSQTQAPGLPEAGTKTSVIRPGFNFRMNFDVRIGGEETVLLRGDPQRWTFLPSDLVTRLEPTRFLYALIGLNDKNMSDFVPPGSLVEIDKEQTEIQHTGWRNLRERPIYLVWHEQGYSCGWCQIIRNTLLIVPCPESSRPILLFKAPGQATVIGRIVHVWYSFCSEPWLAARLSAS